MPTIYDFDVDFNVPVGHLLLFRPSFSISVDHRGTGHHITISQLRIALAFHSGSAAASVLVDLLPLLGMAISLGFSREQIVRCLSSFNFPMEEGDRIQMINFALVKAIVAIRSARRSSGVVHVNIYAHAIGFRPSSERPRDDWTDNEYVGDPFDIPADWIEGGEDRFMVPTDGRAIESLDSRKVSSSSNSGSCTICLEEFMDSKEAMCMPCSHDFHADCIKEWLNNNHYCPLCRFEMPVAA